MHDQLHTLTITTEVVRRWYATWPTTTCETRVMPEHLADDPEPAASAYPTDHPQPMVVYTPPTVGFYRVPEETD